MVHQLFDTSSAGLSHQHGGGFEGRIFQRGRGFGTPARHGAGMGDVFRSVWRFLKPMAMGAVRSIGEEGATAGARILSNLAQGADLKETVKNEGREGVRRVIDRASRSLQKGGGVSKKRKSIKVHPDVVMKPDDVLVGTSIGKKKRVRTDNLGLY